MARVYTFKIVYIGCENKIWRDIQISSNSTMAVLGYAVLSSFSTCAYHLFTMTYKGTNYELDDEEFQTKPKLMSETKLGNLKLEIGDKIHMIYDFGEEQEFEITLLSDEEMSRGSGRAIQRFLTEQAEELLTICRQKICLTSSKKSTKPAKATSSTLTEVSVPRGITTTIKSTLTIASSKAE